VIVVEAVYYS